MHLANRVESLIQKLLAGPQGNCNSAHGSDTLHLSVKRFNIFNKSIYCTRAAYRRLDCPKGTPPTLATRYRLAACGVRKISGESRQGVGFGFGCECNGDISPSDHVV